MPGAGGLHTGSWDLEKHNSYFSFYPEFVQSQWDRLCKCCRSEHLVESPTGQTFFYVKWYTQRCLSSGKALTERFLVLRVFNETNWLGDLCIFLSSKGEPFCLQASLYGLSRNCIYFLGSSDFGEANIAHRLVMSKEIRPSPAPYFIPPQ
ncbi:unnamed protein product [Microthlaspi erraticum]|uniref:KIB1-4 beta-propeller domain-containing protein n=1 Tax=Microthlaspi erraticum TaxID=1685480 RepID=A0A6D2IRQ8_9BRAS|nr:unnamed protein product [Microthlaspi erraticum]